MKIFMCFLCHNFQRRLAWMLSSIAQQEPYDADLHIDVACLPKNGEPSTERLVYSFGSRGMNIGFTHHEREVFAKRGLVRNRQIKQAFDMGADWIFFADADNVYHPSFFRELVANLKGPCAGVTKCIYSKEKKHTEKEATDAHARMAMLSPHIPYAYLRASRIPTIQKGNKPVAAGCMQVCSMDAVMAAGGYYVTEQKCGDRHLFNKGQKARSDRQFRSRMGGSHRIYLPTQIHLGHLRDKEEGTHLELQR